MGGGQKSWIDRGLDFMGGAVDGGAQLVDDGISAVRDTTVEAVHLAQWGNQAVSDHFFGNHERGAAPVDSAQPWSDEGLASRLDWRYQGADGSDLTGSDQLTELMQTMSAPRPGSGDPDAVAQWDQANRDAAMQLNNLRAEPTSPELAMQEYNRFRLLQEQVEASTGKPTEGVDPERHPDHLGSIQQLRCGSYVGEMLDIDPVYGALLNPTGGMTGPGNMAVAAPADSPGSFHGEAHDAFGYLKTHHDMGPGYMYAAPGEAGKFGESDPMSFLAGQHSGFEKWHQLFEDNGAFGPQTPMDVDQELAVTVGGIATEGLQQGVGLARETTGIGFRTDGTLDPLGPGRGVGDTIEGLEDALHFVGTAADWVFD